MSLKNTDNSYGSMAKFFHWGIVVVVYGMLAVGYLQQTMNDGPTKELVYNSHQMLGLTILFTIILRLTWRFSNTTPSLPNSVPAWQKFASRLVHFLLYVMLLMMPISGWIMTSASKYIPSFFGLFSVPMPGIPQNELLANRAHKVHEVVAIVLISLIVIHIAAALKHHFIDKDNVLRRMLPFVK